MNKRGNLDMRMLSRLSWLNQAFKKGFYTKAEIVKRTNFCPSTFEKDILKLRGIGVPIEFDRKTHAYYYGIVEGNKYIRVEFDLWEHLKKLYSYEVI